MQTAKDFAIQKFAKDLVDSVDNLDRALAMVPEEKLSAKEKNENLQDLISLYDGLRMTESMNSRISTKTAFQGRQPAAINKRPEALNLAD